MKSPSHPPLPVFLTFFFFNFSFSALPARISWTHVQECLRRSLPVHGKLICGAISTQNGRHESLRRPDGSLTDGAPPLPVSPRAVTFSGDAACERPAARGNSSRRPCHCGGRWSKFRSFGAHLWIQWFGFQGFSAQQRLVSQTRR